MITCAAIAIVLPAEPIATRVVWNVKCVASAIAVMYPYA